VPNKDACRNNCTGHAHHHLKEGIRRHILSGMHMSRQLTLNPKSRQLKQDMRDSTGTQNRKKEIGSPKRQI
jgi:hypothetical protein